MGKVIDSIIIIKSTEPAKCEYCGKIAKLETYGKENKNICSKCGDKIWEKMC